MARIRRNSVDNGSIISAIVRGAKAGKSNAEVASELGMALPSFQSRSSAIRSVLAEAGRDLPCLGKRGRPSKNIKETLASLDADVLAALASLDELGNPVALLPDVSAKDVLLADISGNVLKKKHDVDDVDEDDVDEDDVDENEDNVPKGAEVDLTQVLDENVFRTSLPSV